MNHYPYPLSTHPHPAEDPANLAGAHLLHTQSAGNKAPQPVLGMMSHNW